MSTVLLVEDNPSDRALFRTILARGGFVVHEVADGRDTPARARELRPLVVLLDVNLPDTDGYTVCRTLKADPLLSGIPVLMLTLQGDEVDILAGLEAGADDYVAKGSDPAVVLARVRRLVRDRQIALMAAQNEQLAQIGRLLAGIVHEIRGPLAVIRGNAEMMAMTLGDAHEAQRWVQPILRNAQILQLRLEHLMAAVRGGPAVLRPLELPPLVREAADLFLKGCDPRRVKVALITEFAAELPPVRADAGRLIQVLMNLLFNAYEAIHEARCEGRISVRAARCRDSGRDWATIEVTDNGTGIPEAHLPRIFDPFFTTKAGGTGYGLYLASEILREHGGRLTACNPPEGGARFTIWLPMETEAPATIAP